MAKHEIEKQDIEPVVTGKVSKKEKGLIESFIQEDAKTIAKEIKDEIVIPTLKDMLANGFKSAVDRLLYGESSVTYRSSGPRRAGGTNYNNMYSNYGSSPTVKKGHSKYEVDVIEFDSRADVEAVCERLEELVAKYHQFSIADYYRISSCSFESTDYNYGWYDMRGISIVKSRGGWTIDFPKAVPLD